MQKGGWWQLFGGCWRCGHFEYDEEWSKLCVVTISSFFESKVFYKILAKYKLFKASKNTLFFFYQILCAFSFSLSFICLCVLKFGFLKWIINELKLYKWFIWSVVKSVCRWSVLLPKISIRWKQLVIYRMQTNYITFELVHYILCWKMHLNAVWLFIRI